MKCRKYAEYSAAIVGINETFPHEQMHKMLALLQVSSAYSPGSGRDPVTRPLKVR
jgi:hypothetical protein